MKLGFTAQKTSIKAQKIDGSPLKTYSIVLTSFLLQDSIKIVQFFEETFLLANISVEVILEILFLIFSNANIEFAELEKLTWRTYTAVKALLTTSWVKFIGKKKFTKAALDENSKTLVIHVSALKAIIIYLSRAA